MASDPDLLAAKPSFSASRAEELVQEHFGLSGRAEPLPGERDQNFRLLSDAGDRYVLKFANRLEDPELLDMQNQVLERCAATPDLQRTADGTATVTVEGEHRFRVLTWMEGTPLARFRPHGRELMHSLGTTLADFDAALTDFDHPCLERDFPWDLRRAEPVLERRSAVTDPELRALLDRLTDRYHSRCAPHCGDLPLGAIHGDANDWNVMVRTAPGDPLHPRVEGLIDLGDMLRSYRAAEPAVAMAYAMLDKREPLDAAGALVAGYHQRHPLGEHEFAVLFELALLRIGFSAVFAAEQQAIAPDNEYLGISQAPILRSLPGLLAIDPDQAHFALRGACGMEACPSTPTLRAWLGAEERDFAPVVELGDGAAPVLDLGIASTDLAGSDLTSLPALTARLDAIMEQAGTDRAIGRYDELRGLYVSEHFAGSGDEFAERRSLHLGIDLFAPAGTAVQAPLAGRVHSFAINDAPLDYGPTIVLEHDPEDGPRFFTLYGHLDPQSLEGLSIGQSIRRGQRVAWIGAPPHNGGWPPHLHFQVQAHMLGRSGDFPGVARPSERSLWTSVCPDPDLVLRLRRPEMGTRWPAPDAMLERRREMLGSNLSVSYTRPLHIVRGRGTELFDSEGQPYLDLVNNVCHVGHCHPRVVAAATRQSAVLNTNTRYLHDQILAYGDKLLARFPASLEVLFLVCTGSEANELALRLARTHTGRRDVLVLDGAYHGHSAALIDLSPYKHAGPGGAGAPDWVRVLGMPDPYRGPHRDHADQATRYADELRAACEERTGAGHPPAAFLCESLLGCGGQIELPAGYLRQAYAHARAAGAVCIADEVQVGFGRVGSHFWGFESQDVVPDIVTLGKPIGNGHPLAAVVTTRAIADSFANGMEYFNTFGGNPVSCAIGTAVLEVIEAENLQENAQARGEQLLAGLRALQERHPVIGDVRGRGLFLGVELVTDRETRAPHPEAAHYVAERMRARGVLVSTDGPDHNVLKIKPPIVLTPIQVEQALDTLAQVLAETPLESMT